MRILGKSLICGLGDSLEETFQAMLQGQTAFRPITRFDSAPYPQRQAGQLSEETEESLRTRFPDDDLAAALVKAAGLAALQHAPAPSAGTRALVLATNFGPMETLQWAWQERLDTGALDNETYAPATQFLANVAQALDCDGPLAQISMSCASGAAALSVAQDMLAGGRASQALVVAYDALTEFCWCGLTNLHTITTDTMRPFDSRRSGTIFSEGAAAMLLDDGQEGDCFISGAATNNNAFHLTAPRQEAEGSRLVMAESLRQAGLSASDVGHVCAHATSTVANDVTEAAALRNLFGERLSGLTVAAHKSQLGHLLGAAGLAEAAITAQAMSAQVIPPTVGHEQPDAKCMPLDCVAGKPRQVAFSTALTNSAGIGGNNASLVLTDRKTGGLHFQYAPIHLRNIAWVLPSGVGSGRELLEHPEWLNGNDNSALEGFTAKPYLKSVKGYLDPGGHYALAAAALAYNGLADALSNRRGVAAATCFGSPVSAFAFFSQLQTKGPRLASPMVFPHSYANTPANLVAIEFGCAGPHNVFFGPQDPRNALDFAYARLLDGSSDTMLALFHEATCPQALPDGCAPLNGAIALLLSATPTDHDLGIFSCSAPSPIVPASLPQTGVLTALQPILQGIKIP
ncbi:MAG: hypothetical protein IJJ33_03855 [Victivallales bacterium]|nr:hypothetical protein [Victivallales bacterium]